MPDNLPAALIPPFLAQVNQSGDLSGLSLSVDLRGIYANAATRLASRADRYKVYVAALIAGVDLILIRRSAPLEFATELADGSRFFVGFGTSADEMLSAGRFRDVLMIPAQ